MRQDGTRAYANNEANFSVTSMSTDDGVCLTLQLDISSSDPPAPGSFQHEVLVGKIAFFTALGIPDNGFRAPRSATSSRGISRASSRKTPGAAAGRAIMMGLLTA